MRTIAALIAAIAIWTGVQALTTPAQQVTPTSHTTTVEQQVSDSITRDLAEAGLIRFDLAELDEQDAEWLPQLLIGQGWTSTQGDKCECLYPPAVTVMELDDLNPADAAAKAAELAGQGWVRIPGTCNCWTPATQA
jgi:hypothetical protein